ASATAGVRRTLPAGCLARVAERWAVPPSRVGPTLAFRDIPPSAQICLRRRLLLTRDPGFRPRPSGECDTRIRRSGVRALLSGEKSRTQRLTRDSRKNRALRRWRDLSTLSSRRRSGSRQKAARHARRG